MVGESSGTPGTQEEGYTILEMCIEMLFKDPCIQVDLFYTAG